MILGMIQGQKAFLFKILLEEIDMWGNICLPNRDMVMMLAMMPGQTYSCLDLALHMQPKII